jgi:hypothetical protein
MLDHLDHVRGSLFVIIFLTVIHLALQLYRKRLLITRMSTSSETTQDLKIIDFDRSKFCNQSQSPLFSVLPGEIRDRIFAYALADFEDTSVAYDSNTCYRRPDYAAPRRSETALLRTCQLVYQEAFFYPFALAEQTLFLTWPGRRPKKTTTVQTLKLSLALIQKLHGDIELERVRVFAQLFNLEGGSRLREILDTPHFLPRTMTITIRHTGKSQQLLLFHSV